MLESLPHELAKLSALTTLLLAHVDLNFALYLSLSAFAVLGASIVVLLPIVFTTFAFARLPICCVTAPCTAIRVTNLAHMQRE